MSMGPRISLIDNISLHTTGKNVRDQKRKRKKLRSLTGITSTTITYLSTTVDKSALDGEGVGLVESSRHLEGAIVLSTEARGMALDNTRS